MTGPYPDPVWRLPHQIPLVERRRFSQLDGYLHRSDFDPRWPGDGPGYLDLWALTWWNHDDPTITARRRAYQQLLAAHPGLFDTVHGDHATIWLALEARKLTADLAHLLTDLLTQVLDEGNQP